MWSKIEFTIGNTTWPLNNLDLDFVVNLEVNFFALSISGLKSLDSILKKKNDLSFKTLTLYNMQIRYARVEFYKILLGPRVTYDRCQNVLAVKSRKK